MEAYVIVCTTQTTVMSEMQSRGSTAHEVVCVALTEQARDAKLDELRKSVEELTRTQMKDRLVHTHRTYYAVLRSVFQ